MYLNIVKARLLQIRLQLGVLVDGHAADDFRPLLVPVRVAVAFITDEKGSSGLQHPSDLAKALWQIRPEVDGFKGCDQILSLIHISERLQVAAYARVSTEKEEQEDSFERQVEHLSLIHI